VQNDAFPRQHPSVNTCQLTSDRQPVEKFRLDIEPTAENGLRVGLQITVDKPVTVRRERVGGIIGHLGATDFLRLNTALAWVIGLGG
jgi:mRNA interferase MazF